MYNMNLSTSYGVINTLILLIKPNMNFLFFLSRCEENLAQAERYHQNLKDQQTALQRYISRDQVLMCYC